MYTYRKKMSRWFLMVSLLTSSCGWDKKVEDKLAELNGDRYFKNCEEYDQYKSQEYAKPYVQASQANDSSGGNSITPAQEKGVDEANEVAASDEQIFYAREGQIVVIDRKTQKEIGAIGGIEYAEMYVYKDRLVVVQSYMGTIKLFQLVTNAVPELIGSHEFGGYFNATRVIGKNLVLLAGQPYYASYNDYIASSKGGDSRNDVKCNRVVVPETSRVSSQSFMPRDSETRIFSIDLESDAEALAFHGLTLSSSGDAYISKNHIYVSGYSNGEDTSVFQTSIDETTGALNYLGKVSVEGYIPGRWAFREHSDGEGLFITSTVNQWMENSLTHLNSYKLVNNKLEFVAKTDGFGKNENVYAVRYIGSMAYVVTFRRVDPLVAIDLSNPGEPKVVDELKVEGFSSMLYPVADNKRLVGIGSYVSDGDLVTGGAQVSLFDINDPLKVSRLDVSVLGIRGTVSGAAHDHRAFYYDADNAMIAVPFLTYSNWGFKPEEEDMLKTAIFYRIDQDKLSEVGRVDHESLIKKREGCNHEFISVSRIFALDDVIYTMSAAGVKILQKDDPSKLMKAFAFKKKVKCYPYGGYAD